MFQIGGPNQELKYGLAFIKGALTTGQGPSSYGLCTVLVYDKGSESATYLEIHTDTCRYLSKYLPIPTGTYRNTYRYIPIPRHSSCFEGGVANVKSTLFAVDRSVLYQYSCEDAFLQRTGLAGTGTTVLWMTPLWFFRACRYLPVPTGTYRNTYRYLPIPTRYR